MDGERKTVKTKLVVGDPSYFEDKTRVTSQVVRAICLMSHPVPSTDNAGSCQVILPQKQVGRRSDIYISALGSELNVAPPGRFVAMVSTTVETYEPHKVPMTRHHWLRALDDRSSDPAVRADGDSSFPFIAQELAPGIQLLGPIDDVFVEVIDIREPLEDGRRDRCFVSRGYDPTSHFETTVDDVLDLYFRITGRQLDLSSKLPNLQQQE